MKCNISYASPYIVFCNAEFSAIDDDTSRFLVNVLANGSVTLLCLYVAPRLYILISYC
jgi:hypothetical protein